MNANGSGNGSWPLSSSEIVLIDVERIKILNPRSRNRGTFASVVENISNVGLKRPITVSKGSSDEQGLLYDLVCGQGRLEAFKSLGEKHIPCLVIEASEEQRYLMSLIENLARRRHSNQDLLGAVRVMEERGYSVKQIAEKTGLEEGYASVMLHLLREGEERLIAAVERGWLSVSLADKISRTGDAEIQKAMMEAYESGLLRGEPLLKVRRLIDSRSALGKAYKNWPRRLHKNITPQRLVDTYQREVRRQRVAIKKAEVTEGRLLFVLTALRSLLRDEHFRTLLRAEGIEDVPTPLADKLAGN